MLDGAARLITRIERPRAKLGCSNFEIKPHQDIPNVKNTSLRVHLTATLKFSFCARSGLGGTQYNRKPQNLARLFCPRFQFSKIFLLNPQMMFAVQCDRNIAVNTNTLL